MHNKTDTFFTRLDRPKRLISLTPLIDVVFILLIFFMLSSNYQKWFSLPLDSLHKSQGQGKPQVILVRLKVNSFDINGKPMKLLQLNQYIKDKMRVMPNLQVLIQPIGAIVVQRLVNMVDQINDAGCENIAIVES